MMHASYGMQTSEVIELFENERYSPLSGWSSRGLLLTDRSAFSTKDGSGNWSTAEEAARALLPNGWIWTEGSNWQVELSSPFVDEAGWTYCTDFNSINDSPCGVKGMVHFVRRRRMLRSMTFMPTSICKELLWTCDFCDLDERARLSKLLLTVLVESSITKHPRMISESKIRQLKSNLVESLCLGGPPLGLERVEQALIDYASEGRSTFTMVFGSGTDENALSEARMAEFSSQYFKSEERDALVDVIIRKHDAFFQIHCNVPNCSTAAERCVFAPETCPNQGCETVYSRKWALRHDGMCLHKIIECNRACGESTKRKDMEAHLTHACALRPVPCPFADMGCIAELVQKDVADHLDKCVQSHLLLTLGRVHEQQSVIVNLHKRVNELEKKTGEHVTQIAQVVAAAAAASVAVEECEKRVNKTINTEVSKLEQKSLRKSTEVQSELRTEVSRLNRAVQELTTKENERQRRETGKR